MGVTLQGREKREAPVRAEPHPTSRILGLAYRFLTMPMAAHVEIDADWWIGDWWIGVTSQAG
jgi:hypothetical protein